MMTKTEDAESFLSQVIEMDKLIEEAEEDYIAARRALGMCSPMVTDLPRNPSPSLQQMEAGVIRLGELRSRLEWLRRERIRKMTEIIMFIQKIGNPIFQKILTSHYVQMAGWDEIAMNMEKSKEWVRLQKKEALNEVAVILAEERGLTNGCKGIGKGIHIPGNAEDGT